MISVILGILTCIGLFVQNSAALDRNLLSTEIVAKAEDARERALDWLASQRNDEFGWGDGYSTAKVILALASSNQNWPQKSDLEARLSAKQLEVELLATLLRHGIEPITAAHTSYYFMALTAICKNPYNFYGHNLVETLVRQQKDQDYSGFVDTFGYGLSSLVTCLGETHFRKRQTRHLFQLLLKYESIETRSIASLTLECIRHSRNSETLKRHLHEGLETLGGMQRADGSFGDTHSTAMAIQGLGAIEESKSFWNHTSALLALLSQQSPTGSFNEDIQITSEAILGISTLIDGIGLLSFKRHRCQTFNAVTDKSNNNSTTLTSSVNLGSSNSNNKANVSNVTKFPEVTTNPPMLSETSVENALSKSTTTTEELFSQYVSSNTPSPISKVSVQYWLWIGPQPITAEKYNMTVEVPFNSTFYQVMQKAAEKAPIFEFSSAIWPNGHYVHTISGHREQPSGYNYWLLYRLPSVPEPTKPPGPEYVAEAGVDELMVQDGEIYLFWFKKI